MGQLWALPPSVRFAVPPPGVKDGATKGFTPFGFAPKGQRTSVAPLVRFFPRRGKTQNKGATYKLPLWYTPGGGKAVCSPKGGKRRAKLLPHPLPPRGGTAKQNQRGNVAPGGKTSCLLFLLFSLPFRLYPPLGGIENNKIKQRAKTTTLSSRSEALRCP